MKTKDELLKPRFKVIADYPNSPFKICQILESIVNNNYETVGQIYTDRFPEKYPHLFKKLEWWEERSVEDLPKYVKSHSDAANIFQGGLYKVDTWHEFEEETKLLLSIKTAIYYAIINGKPNRLNVSHFVPATKEEYDEYCAKTYKTNEQNNQPQN